MGEGMLPALRGGPQSGKEVASFLKGFAESLKVICRPWEALS